jgi:hypothetical protein
LSVHIASTLFAFLLISTVPARAAEPKFNLIDSKDYTDPRQYAFLSPLLDRVEVVSLAESIHMTHEFPLIRIGMVTAMNHNLGFRMVALEGSPEDLWVTQDQFLATPEAGPSQAMAGVFGVWNTAEMEQLFRYELATWSTSHPLYLTAYDIQPGMGSGTQGLRVFELLLERLRTYAPPPAGFEEGKWLDAAVHLTSSCSAYQTSDETIVSHAIAELEQWIDVAAPEVEKLPHSSACGCAPPDPREHASHTVTLQGGRVGNAGLAALQENT